ncbi:hypothetical protein JTE90_020489 [Oedothorax gibbosus]|uniref:Uncharacterized protein n=1 Tax=Oedothorax gibbosus TaxID=931172 RepID=A0AAV6UU78_9ARAC|nr:hypothetical protein JTE90_020489 [Oedothorax gibbosus]
MSARTDAVTTSSPTHMRRRLQKSQDLAVDASMTCYFITHAQRTTKKAIFEMCSLEMSLYITTYAQMAHDLRCDV